VKKYQCTDTF